MGGEGWCGWFRQQPSTTPIMTKPQALLSTRTSTSPRTSAKYMRTNAQNLIVPSSGRGVHTMRVLQRY